MKAVDKLKWAKITDDFGDINPDDDGVFYGLEEIDGYGVDKSDGTLKFIEATQKPEKSQKPATSSSSAKPTKNKSKGLKEISDGEKSKAPVDFVDFSAIKDAPEPKRLLQSLNDWPGLSPALYTALEELGFSNPTEIQKQAIPPALKGLDLIGKASTGSGKTLAFGLPIIDAYINEGTPGVPQALIIAPTRELAHQIGDHLNAVISKCQLGNTSGCVTVTGGLAYQKQLRLLERNPVIVVGTPGRLYDVLDKMPASQISNYQKIPTMVLDEADRLVQNNSFEDLDNIIAKIGRAKRQTMVFSATFDPEYWAKLDSRKKVFRKNTPQDIRQVLETKLALRKNALFIDADPKDAVASAIVQSIMECPGQEKDIYLYYFALIYPGKSIVFVNSIDAVKRITPLMKEMDQPAFGVHSDMVQKQRLRSIERFRDTPNAILIATDVAARGLDVPEVDHVVHYNLPRTADMYVHRSGRTARAGKAGVSLMLCSPEEASTALPKLCKLVKTKPVPFDVEYDILDRLRERVILAKRIADAVNKSTHEGKKKAWEAQAAEDLGLELSDQEQETKSERKLKGYRAELKMLLSQKIGPNRKYLTSGSVNLAREMLKNPTAIVAGRAASTALESLAKTGKNQPKELKEVARKALQTAPQRAPQKEPKQDRNEETKSNEQKPKVKIQRAPDQSPPMHKMAKRAHEAHDGDTNDEQDAKKPKPQLSQPAKKAPAKKVKKQLAKDENGFVKRTHKLKNKGQTLNLSTLQSINTKPDAD